MRPPRESMLILGLLTTVCLLGGVVVGVALGMAMPSLTNTPTVKVPISPPTPTPSAQITVLLLGVNSLASTQPELDSCWVLTFQPGIPQYYLVGFSPWTPVKLPGSTVNQDLIAIYATDRHIAVGSSLFTRDAVQVISPGLSRPEAEVVFDRQMLATSVDMLGGIVLYGEHLDGQTLLARYDAVPLDNPLDRIAFQHDVLVAVTEAIKRQAWSLDTLRPYFDLGQEWHPDADWFLALAQAQAPFADAEFVITYAPVNVESTQAP